MREPSQSIEADDWNDPEEISLIKPSPSHTHIKHQYSNDIENIFIQSNVVTVNFTKNMGTAIKEFEKQIEDFFLFYGDEEE